MAGTGEIKQKIVLEGEKEYSAALKEANRNLKVLRSELKAETAELGKNAKEQDKVATKAKYLKQQIAEQEKIVKTYEKALEEVKKRYGDNEDAIARWEVKLNDARTALANMRGSLEETGASMKAVGDSAALSTVATNSLADSLTKVANAGGAISGAIESAFSGITGMISDTVAAVWESVVDLAARSNNLVDLAGFWNTDVSTIQKYAGAVAHVSGNLEDLNSLVTKINSLDEKKVAELTGVSKVGYNDQWEYAMAVMDAMSKLGNRNDVGFALFGKSATKAFDLLNDWTTLQEHLDEYDPSKGGYGLSDEQVQKMSDLYDKVNGLKQSWQFLQDMATVNLFGNLALNVTGDLQTIVDAFKDYFNAEDDAGREAAIQKVKNGIISLFEHVRDAMSDGIALLTQLAQEFKASDDPVIRAIGEAFDSVKNILEWFTDPANWDAIKTGFETIIGIWAAGKVTTAIANLAAFVSHIATIRGFGGGGGGGSIGGGGGTGTVTGAAAGAAKTGGLLGGLARQISLFGAAGGAALAGTIGSLAAAGAAGVSMIRANLNDENLNKIYGRENGSGDLIDTMGPAAAALAAEYFKLYQNASGTEAAYDARDALQAELEKEGYENSEQGVSLLENTFEQFLKEMDIDGTVERIEQRHPGIFDGSAAEIEEDVLLDAHTREEAADAIQDWFDAWREFDQNPTADNSREYDASIEWLKEVFGDNWGDVYERMIEKLDETDTEGMTDVPEGWYSDMLDSMNFEGQQDEALQKSIDGLNKLPEQIERATAKGVSGIKVQLDGYTVGSLVAPYVSTFVARDLIT